MTLQILYYGCRRLRCHSKLTTAFSSTMNGWWSRFLDDMDRWRHRVYAGAVGVYVTIQSLQKYSPVSWMDDGAALSMTRTSDVTRLRCGCRRLRCHSKFTIVFSSSMNGRWSRSLDDADRWRHRVYAVAVGVSVTIQNKHQLASRHRVSVFLFIK